MVIEKRVQHPRLEHLVYFIQECLVPLGLLAGLDTLGCLQVKVYMLGLVEKKNAPQLVSVLKATARAYFFFFF